MSSHHIVSWSHLSSTIDPIGRFVKSFPCSQNPVAATKGGKLGDASPCNGAGRWGISLRDAASSSLWLRPTGVSMALARVKSKSSKALRFRHPWMRE